MERTIYQSIAERTGKQIYVGVVGPVRTGKSTFIKNFMEQLVLTQERAQWKLSNTMVQHTSQLLVQCLQLLHYQ